MVIERGIGRLVADCKPYGTTENRADLLSRMIAAIGDFSLQALAGEGKLRIPGFDEDDIVLRALPHTILAGECVGSLRLADDAKINALFCHLLEAIGGGGRVTFENVFRGEMRR